MADTITAEEIKRAFLEALKEADSGKSTGGTAGKSALDPKDLDRLKREVDYLTKSFTDNRSKVTKFGDFLAGAKKNVITLDQFDKEITALNKAIETAADATEAKTLIEKKEALQRTVATNNNIAAMQNFTQEMRKLTGTGIKGAGDFVKGLQSGGSGMELATGMMNTAVDLTAGATSAMGNAMGTAGQTMMASTNPKLKALGMAASIAGPLLSQAGEAAGKLAKFGIEVLSKEVEKTVKAFNETSASGALFADGMTGMRNAAGAAGLTVEQFSGVVKNNSDALAAGGLGVTEGAKRIGNAMKVGGDTAKDQLLKLGYSFEEQAGLYATVAGDMNKNAMGRKASDAQIADQTMKYAENLRTISAITGEDAKKKMDQVKQEANQLAFRQKLAKLPLEQQEATKRAMANMSDIERKNFMDMVNFGSVINKEGAIYESAVDGAADKTQSAFDAFNKGTLDSADQQKRNAEYGQRINQSIMEGNEALGTAAAVGGSSLTGLADSMSKQVDTNNKYSEEAVKAAQENVEAQKNTTDKLTDSVVGAEKAAQDLKVALQETLLPAISKFAEVSKEMLGAVQKQLKELGLGGKEEKPGSGEEKGMLGKIGDKLSGFNSYLKESKVLSTGASVAGGAALVGGAAASVTGVGAIGGVPLAVIGGVLEGIGTVAGALGYARGGISKGDPEGYLAKLHGDELVVPLDGSGKLDMDSLGYSELSKLISNTSNAGGTAPATLGGLSKSAGPDPSAMMADAFKSMSATLGSKPAGMPDDLKDSIASMGTNFADFQKKMQEQANATTDTLTPMAKQFDMASVTSGLSDITAQFGKIVEPGKGLFDKIDIGTALKSAADATPFGKMASGIFDIFGKKDEGKQEEKSATATTAATENTAELIKEQNELLKQALSKYEEMISVMEENAGHTQRLLHSMN